MRGGVQNAPFFIAKEEGGKVQKKHEKAYLDFVQGYTYQELADKYAVAYNTVKSWARRYDWSREIKCTSAPCTLKGAESLRSRVEQSLMTQLKNLGATQAHYFDLVNDYMKMWDAKNGLIADIDKRGVVVTWQNGQQKGKKRNDSVLDLIKLNAQMLKLLESLGLSAANTLDGGDETEEEEL